MVLVSTQSAKKHGTHLRSKWAALWSPVSDYPNTIADRRRVPCELPMFLVGCPQHRPQLCAITAITGLPYKSYIYLNFIAHTLRSLYLVSVGHVCLRRTYVKVTLFTPHFEVQVFPHEKWYPFPITFNKNIGISGQRHSNFDLQNKLNKLVCSVCIVITRFNSKIPRELFLNLTNTSCRFSLRSKTFISIIWFLNATNWQEKKNSLLWFRIHLILQ